MVHEIIHIDKHDQNDRGVLTVIDYEKIPFTVKRVFWIDRVSPHVVRGQHKHLVGEEVLIAQRGSLSVKLQENDKESYVLLDSPTVALWIRPGTFVEMSEFSTDAILLVLCSHPFKEDTVSSEI